MLVPVPLHTVAFTAAIALSVGAALTVKLLALVPLPAVLVTTTLPVEPLPIVAIIWVDVPLTIAATAVPPMVTFAAVAPVKLDPLIIIFEPAQPDVLPNDEMIGTACTVVVLLIDAVPHVLVLKCTNKSLVLVVVNVTEPLPKPSTVPLALPTLTVIISLATLIVNL